MKKNMNGEKTTCPKCLGTQQVFTGKYMKVCRLCKDGEVSNEMEEAFIEEQLPYE